MLNVRSSGLIVRGRATKLVDPLSEVLSLLKVRSYACGGFAMPSSLSMQMPQHPGTKCYAIISGQCWLSVEGVSGPRLLAAGDCILLPPGAPFCLATDPSIPSVDFRSVWPFPESAGGIEPTDLGACYLFGGHFALEGAHADLLLGSLPPIVHIRKEADRAAMRWSLERMKDEVRDPQPGGSLMAQQLAYMMLIQALRLHLTDADGGTGWLFALADKHMSKAIQCLHEQPGHSWTLHTLAERVGMSRSVFALRFKQLVGMTPMDYLTRWRMLLAGNRLESTSDSIAEIASSLGYDSESAFGKAFRRTMGCSPRRYSRAGVGAPQAF